MKILRLFAGRHVFLVASLLAVLVSLPTIGSGLFLDDYQQRSALLAGAGSNVFDFYPRGTGWTEAQIQSGVLAWWFYPGTKVTFFRPVGQWLMQLDYRLWPNNVAMMHLHSVLWYGLAVIVAGLSYRKIMPTRWAAGLAAVLFAIDAAHGPAVAWLSNRSAYVGISAALLALLCYRRRQPLFHIAGCALFACSLACSEAALAIAGYFFAYEVCLADQPWHRRLLRLLPYALVALGWLVFWRYQGYGTAGPGWYIDPAGEPLLFLRALVLRSPLYLTGQMFLPPVEILTVGEVVAAMQPYTFAYGLICSALLAWLLMPLLRHSRTARFFGLGALIALIPICGSIPVSRSLWFVGFGATGMLALFIEQFRSLPQSAARLRLSAACATGLLVVHLGISPLLFVASAKLVEVMDSNTDSRHLQLPDDGAPGRKVLALSASSYVGNITYPLLRDRALSLGAAPARASPSIDHIRALVETSGEFELRRKDRDTLVASSPAGFETLRPSRFGFAVGDRVALDDVEVLVKSVSPAKAPTEIEYRFQPGVLETYQVITWQGDRFVAAVLPAPGASIDVKARGS